MDLIALLVALAGTATAAEACDREFAETEAVDALSPRARIPVLLDVLTRCELLPAAIRRAAARAARGPDRAAALARGGAAQCRVADPAVSAASFAARCPGLELGPGHLVDLDAGSYVFLLALDRAIEERRLGEEARMIFFRLALALALANRSR